MLNFSKYLNKKTYINKVKKLNDEYWNSSYEGRWIYLNKVIEEIEIIKPKTILELGANKINLSTFSDNMSLSVNDIDLDNKNNKTFIKDATIVPWSEIKNKEYDLFVSLQVFEHFEGKQKLVFNEIKRISKYAILSFPYKWNKPDDYMHHNLNENVINYWVNDEIPEKIIYIKKPDNRKRVIYVFKF